LTTKITVIDERTL